MSNFKNDRTVLSQSLLRRLAPVGVAALLGAGISGCHSQAISSNAQTAPTAPTHPVAVKPTGPPPMPALPPEGVRGIYLTGWTAGTKNHFNHLLKLVDETELNAMVIDVKDDGEVSFDMDVPLVKKIHASKKMFKADKVMPILAKHNIFSIARIACMRDTPLAEARPDLAVQDASGNVWHDRSGHAWLNPYKKEVWDYNVDIALQAVKHGFKDIQFDYVRFPSEGNLNNLHFPGKPKDALREDQIVAFMKYAHEKIHAQGAYFSADVFGLTSLVTNDEGIGQKFVKVIQNVEFLSPMVYPSHYHKGEYGIPDPNKNPYKIIHLSVGDAVKKIKKVKTCHLRPWIQDFSLFGVHYGPTQVKAQMKALSDLGIHDFLLWNAACRYTESAYAKATPSVASVPDSQTAQPVGSTKMR